MILSTYSAIFFQLMGLFRSPIRRFRDIATRGKSKRERILALDLMRGSFMLAIIVDHVAWAPSLLYILSGGGLLFASPAEGFFVISGVLIGYIYRPKIISHTKQVIRKLWKRAAVLYCLAVVFTLFYTAWALSLAPQQIPSPLWARDGTSFLLNTFSLRYAYGWTDFLPRYVIFLLVAPFVVWLVAKGKAWLVVAGSFVVWLLFHETALLLPFSAWQLLFIVGIVVGYYLANIETAWKRLSHQTKTFTAWSIWSAAAASFVLSVVWLIVIPYLASTGVVTPATTPLSQLRDYLAPWFDKETLAIGRLLLGAIWFVALYLLFRLKEKSINSLTRGVLEVIGKNSLFVYCLHGFVVFIINVWFGPPTGSGLILNTIISANIVYGIYLVTKHRAIFTKIKHRLFPSLAGDFRVP